MSTNLFTIPAVVSTVCLTAADVALGGFDLLGKALLTLIVIDYLTALIVAACEKKFNSEIGYKGILKKFLIVLVVFAAATLNELMPDVPIRVVVISFYLSNEGISILENVSKFLPVPQKMKDCFEQLREKEGEKNE